MFSWRNKKNINTFGMKKHQYVIREYLYKYFSYLFCSSAFLLDAPHWEIRARNQNWSAQCQYNETEWNVTSCIVGVTFQ